ncbi:MAG: polysaccharide pyruvyl transferase family protein [Bacteroides thetaiotaomicron]
MRILTLTTQYANNMGALLQCYALSRFINGIKGTKCEVIDYYPVDANKSWSIFHKPTNFRDFAKICVSVVMVHHYPARYRRNKEVRRFIKEYIPLTNQEFDSKSIHNNPPEADVFICGSDQIWNPALFHDDLTYYFDFVKSGRKVAYAASATKAWNTTFAEKIRPLLRDFSAISMREDTNLKQVNQLSGLQVTTTIDPVFLLNAEDWLKVAEKPVVNEPYILCYFIGSEKKYNDLVNLIKQETGYKVVHLNVNLQSHVKADYEFRDVHPQKFVGYIANASYVLTNSFHCTAFSIIFKKSLKFILKPQGNSRVEMLCKYFNLKNVMIDKAETQLFLPTNYNNIQDGVEYIEQSKHFIRHAITE